MARRTCIALATSLLLAAEVQAAPGPPLVPGQDQSESRSILRDVDRTRTNVAGEADAAAVVANPANMGFMRAVGGVLEGSWTRPEARRRELLVELLLDELLREAPDEVRSSTRARAQLRRTVLDEVAEMKKRIGPAPRPTP